MVQIRKRAAKQSKHCCSGLGTFLSPRFFKALSDPKRVSLLIRLAEKREACTIGQLAEGSGVDFSVVSRHLGVLRDAGIIKREKRGKEVWCMIERHGVVEFLRNVADALEACCPDDRRAIEERTNSQAARRPVG
jgi:DNA-binding transcriptional ArsR family regulator